VILVVGATGLLGGEICRLLRERGNPVRALVREGSPREEALRALGAEIVHGDLKAPPSLDRACAGVQRVATTANSILSRRAGDNLRSVDRDGQLALIAAARSAGVNHFVYTSVSPGSSRALFVQYKREVETAVRGSGMKWTILQPAAFMEIAFSRTAGWDIAAGRATIVGSGNARVSYVSVEDVARFAVRALEGDEFTNRNLPLGGPEAVSPLEAVCAFENAAGRRFAVRRVPTGVLGAIGRLLTPFDPIKASLMTMVADAAVRGDSIDMKPLLESDAAPHQLIPLREYAESALGKRSGDGAHVRSFHDR
jgi:uncharacterized protein YbjT (DUF2867 family)